MTKIKIQKKSRVCQGDIYKDIEYIENIFEKSGIIEISKIIFPLVIVLTQDCDLKRDYIQRWSKKKKSDNQDKWLMSLLVAPLYNAEHVFEGKHLDHPTLHMVMEPIPKKNTPGKYLIDNRLARYHYIKFPDNIDISDSIIDFKHYFSINGEYIRKIKKKNFVCRVSELYREDISLRFTNFLSRIGLP